MRVIGKIVLLVAVGLCVAACDNEGAGGAGGQAGTGGVAGTGGADDFPLNGFTVAPPPVGEEFKEKASHEEKLAALLEGADVPTALGGAFFQLSRAYLSGRAAENDLERSAFEILDATTPDVREAISRTLDGVDALASEDRERLYVARFVNASASDVLTVDTLADAVAGELRARASLAIFDDADPSACLDAERPGLPRVTFCPDADGDYPGFCNVICRVGAPSLVQPIRTWGYIPFLGVDAYEPHEVERECTIDPEGGPPSCSTVTAPDCRGDVGPGGDCLAVPTVERGESVTLRGFNFFDVDAVVVITSTPPQDFLEREVPAHVCGDIDAGANATLDCGINDLISFVIPTDLPVGRYVVSVVVPNNTGDPVHNRASYFTRRGRQYLDVVPPFDTEFELVSLELHCIDETGRTRIGSDEIGLEIITTQVESDGRLGPLNIVEFEFGGVDDGNRRRMDRRHFQGALGTGLAIAIVGYEIDNREAYEQEIRTFTGAFNAIYKSTWGYINGTVGAAVGAVAGYYLGSVELGAAVAALVAATNNAVLALWAPADLIIEDYAGVSFRRMVELTSQNFPNPPLVEQTTAGGIDVTVEPCEDTEDRDRPECEASAKASQQYRERREYRSGKARSEYQITLEYRRVN